MAQSTGTPSERMIEWAAWSPWGGEGDAAVALASRVFVAHASPDGKTEALVAELREQGRRVLTFDDPENRRLLDMGVEPVAPGTLPG